MHATSLTSAAAEDISSALEREKSLFLQRNFERCGYLRVQFEPDASAERLVIAASFTLDAVRRWHRVEAVLPTAGADGATGVAAAFRRLEEGIGAARIAELFAPQSASRRVPLDRPL